MTRSLATRYAAEYFDSGRFQAELAGRIGHRTEGGAAELYGYLDRELAPAARQLGAAPRLLDNPVDPGRPVFLARRREGAELPTVLVYGHADVVPAEEHLWPAGLDPWRLTVDGDRWYGRGSTDNKGQHTVNLAALAQVLRARGNLGFNLTILIETAEEIGSPGLAEVCAAHRDELAADLLIASDGHRVAADRPTVFLGTRGSADFTLRVRLRDRSHQSGHWGGVLRNPATVLANAVACLVDGRGRLRVAGLNPPPMPAAVREMLRAVPVGGEPGDPAVDQDWGEPGLSPAERLLGWNTLEILSLAAGHPERAVGMIAGHAHAHCQLRFVPGTDTAGLPAAVRSHLDRHGFEQVDVEPGPMLPATRTDPADRWVRFVLASLAGTLGAAPAVQPNCGGTLPNGPFADDLGMPTIWIPHSYAACSQHVPGEHLLAPLARQALTMMTGLFWDLGDPATRDRLLEGSATATPR